MEHNATATYVADADPRRSRTYPFREGQHIPRTLDIDGMTFSLRAVCYEPPAVVRDEIADAIQSAKAALDAVQTARREWNARLYGGTIASDEATTSFGQSEAA